MELKMENKTMEHLKMHSLNKIDENIAKIATLFPNCVTEAKDDNGEIIHKIDFDMLKQELSSTFVDGREERYQFTWPDKRQAILTANAPINKTLRPCREESVNFDNTQNLYIEGDNLEVLKLLQETCRKENMTVVLITHNSAITPMADHIIKMRSGRVIMDVYNDEPKNVEEIEW